MEMDWRVVQLATNNIARNIQDIAMIFAKIKQQYHPCEGGLRVWSFSVQIKRLCQEFTEEEVEREHFPLLPKLKDT